MRILTLGILVLCGIATQATAQLSKRVHASGFANPVAFVQDPTDRTVQFVVQQGGLIRVVRNRAVLPAVFLDLRAATGGVLGEQGLLGLAFAPDYAVSGRFFVNFTNVNGNTVVARFHRSSNPLVADPASRFDLRWGGTGAPRFIAQPFPNHNGGHLAFGPVDGYLYIGLGDGGSGNDPGHRAQDPAQLLGKMLRIDVNVLDSDPGGYRVPPDNPFVGSALPGVRPEIWSFGLRNPWRYSFDDTSHGGTGALIIGDVGQGAWEEVDYEPANRGGRNYGWRNREGAHDNVTSRPPAFTPLTDPIHEYGRASGVAVTGGFVYRGHRLGTAYQGRYFFADFGSGRVWSMALTLNSTGEAQASNLTEHTAELGTAVNVSSFGVDADGELYLVSYTDGQIYAIGRAGAARTSADLDGDGRSDLLAWRASSGTWRWTTSSSGYSDVDSKQWGNQSQGDVPLNGDIDADGRDDLIVWRANTGTWYWTTSSTGYTDGDSRQWGNQGLGDVPLVGDFDGDGKADLVVWRASTGTWYWTTSSTGYTGGVSKQWGNQSLGDVPLLGDVDGDGKADLLIWRASTGTWYWTTSSAGYTDGGSRQWGNQGLGDLPIAGDLDGDGKTDLTVWRASTGTWYWTTSSTGYAAGHSKQWGNQGLGDVPRLGDLDGDGRADLVVWRAGSGTWYWLESSSGYDYATGAGRQFGDQSLGDVPMMR
jgi:VCBS repeat protein